MAYGTEAGVLFNLGRASAEATGYFTSANIAVAIAQADVIIDQINSSASSSTKTQASNMLAADLMWNNWAQALTNGLAQQSGTQGEPQKQFIARKIPSQDVKNLLSPRKAVFDTTDPTNDYHTVIS